MIKHLVVVLIAFPLAYISQSQQLSVVFDFLFICFFVNEGLERATKKREKFEND